MLVSMFGTSDCRGSSDLVVPSKPPCLTFAYWACPPSTHHGALIIGALMRGRLFGVDAQG
jgi:hypothetical protein